MSNFIKRTILKSLEKMPWSLSRVFYTLKTTYLPTDYLPNFNKIFIYFFYRFPIFRNKFYKYPQIYFNKHVPTKSEIIDFQFDLQNIKEIEKKGISTPFSFEPKWYETIYEELNQNPIDWDGKIIKKPIREILNLDFKNEGIVQANYIDLPKNSKLMQIATNPTIINFVAGYLKSNKIQFDILSWWSFPIQLKELKSNYFGGYNYAREYHFDHVGRRCLKLFCYVLDCDDSTGPHSYIQFSHLKKPFQVALKELNLSGEKLQKYMKKDENWLKVTGKAGVGFMMDPFGLHCGIAPTEKARLVLEFNYYVDPMDLPHLSTGVNVPRLLKTALAADATP